MFTIRRKLLELDRPREKIPADLWQNVGQPRGPLLLEAVVLVIDGYNSLVLLII